jgi:hypothetical protein
MNTDQSKSRPGSIGSGEDDTFVYANIRSVFLKRFPELWGRIEASFGSYYDLKSEFPGTYPLFEDVLKERVIEFLKAGADDDSLERIFSFYEEMARSQDEDIVTLLWISTMERLVYERNSSPEPGNTWEERRKRCRER